MSNFLNLPSFSSARAAASDRLSRLQESPVLDRFRSPPPGARPFSGLPLPESTGGLLPERGVGSSGESNPSSRVSGGVGDLSLFEMTPELLSTMCCGVVSKGVKFCTLGSSKCGFSGHNKKVLVYANELYISTGRNGAFSHHHAKVSLLSPSQLREVLMERHSQEEWVRLLHILNTDATQRDPFTFTSTFGDGEDPNRKISAITPARKRKDRYVGFNLTDDAELSTKSSRSAELDTSDIIIIPSASTEDLSDEEKIQLILSQWADLVSTVNRSGSIIKALKNTIGDDVEMFHERLTSVDARIGDPADHDSFTDCVTVWDGLGVLSSTMEDLSKQMGGLQGEISQFDVTNMKIEELQRGVTEIAAFLQILDQEHAAISAGKGVASPNEALLLHIQDDVRNLRTQLQVLQRTAGEPRLPPATTVTAHDFGASAAEVAALKLQVALLESRLPASAIQPLGGEIFKSKAEVKLFIETKMPSNTYSVFHDVVTLLESLSGIHIERKDVINEIYQADKIGYSDSEARHISSFRIVLPTILGYVKEGSASKHNLPAVRTFEDWNPQDGVSGIKDYIMTGVVDLQQQITQEIDDLFDPVSQPEARALALDMLSQSQRFIVELVAWIDQFYVELIKSSQATADEAWELISSLVRRIFEKLREVRNAAATASREKVMLQRSTTILWALVQSHNVMRSFVDARFRNHGAIAPVIVLHVFKTRVTVVAHNAAIKRLEGRLAVLEKSGGGNGNNGGKKQHANNANSSPHEEGKKEGKK